MGGEWGAEKENETCLASCSPTMIYFHFNACTPIIATLKRLENGQQVGNHVCIPDFAIRKMKMKQCYGEQFSLDSLKYAIVSMCWALRLQ